MPRQMLELVMSVTTGKLGQMKADKRRKPDGIGHILR
jgi:hypothetical protein